MKLTAVVILSVFCLGSTYTLAGHRHGDSNRHEGCAQHKRVQHDHRQQRERQRYARVIDVEPVYRYYEEPVSDHSCTTYDRGRADYTSHTATVLGAVIGGALGHRVGDAHGDPTVAAVAGGLLGASVGRDVGRRVSYNRGLRVEGPCRVQHRQETRRQLVEYKVSYRYNGRVHHARMDYDPGEWVKLDVNVTPA
jgi:uncharacterized protein YcfJ